MLNYIWLQLVFSSSKANSLLKKFGSAKEVNSAYAEGRIKLSEYSQKRIKFATPEYCAKIIEQCKRNNIKIVRIGSPDYPYLLSQIPDPPVALYVQGDVSFLNSKPCVCIAGPRKATEKGIKAAFSLSSRLAACGFGIISGCADGIDTAAHLGTVGIGAKSAMILPCGLLHPYRKDKDSLKRRILKNGGCIISEYPPETEDGRNNFRPRNRLMAGLALASVIPEAGNRSGSLITAGFAAEYGRDVFTVPHRINDEYHKGSNGLLNDGARPLGNAMDIVGEYVSADVSYAFTKDTDRIISNAYKSAFDELFPKKAEKSVFHKTTKLKTAKPDETKKTVAKRAELSNDALAVYKAIKQDLFLPDTLDISETDLEKGIFLALFELERAGYIESAPSGYYKKLP